MLRVIKLLIAGLVACLVVNVTGCGPTNAWMKADGLFKDQQYKEAAAAYTEAAKKYPDRPELVFNAGTARHMAKDYQQARRTFQKVAKDATGDLKEKAEYNTGNTCMANQDRDSAIEHYKRALYLRPGDMNAKWNLEMAQRKQKQQKKQKQQDDKEKQSKDDQQQRQDRRQEDQKQKDQNKEDQNKSKQQQDRQNQEQKQEQQQRQTQKKQLSEEEVQRLLRAMAEEDKKLQKRLRKPKYRSRTAPSGKDW